MPRARVIDDLRALHVRYSTDADNNARARRYGSAVSVVFMDLDGFKMVNDIYGHRAGSVTLTEVAEVITLSVREADFVARYGGDEFVLMLPETPAERALQVAERVRSQIAGHRFTGGVGAEIYLTASFGVASFPEHAAEAEKLIELAVRQCTKPSSIITNGGCMHLKEGLGAPQPCASLDAACEHLVK